MQNKPNRREFLAGLSATGAASMLGARASPAAEGPLETTTVRLTTAAGICIAPQYLAGELLRADGFTDVHFVPALKGPPGAVMIGRGEADFTSTFALRSSCPLMRASRSPRSQASIADATSCLPTRASAASWT
jgi:NitT/TauT family transport system substrate-binding protein